MGEYFAHTLAQDKEQILRPRFIGNVKNKLPPSKTYT